MATTDGTTPDGRPPLLERDDMLCRSCGRAERASEGYPCENCGTFICLVCTIRGVTLCQNCAPKEPST